MGSAKPFMRIAQISIITAVLVYVRSLGALQAGFICYPLLLIVLYGLNQIFNWTGDAVPPPAPKKNYYGAVIGGTEEETGPKLAKTKTNKPKGHTKLSWNLKTGPKVSALTA